jgi:hypothetical protein
LGQAFAIVHLLALLDVAALPGELALRAGEHGGRERRCRLFA